MENQEKKKKVKLIISPETYHLSESILYGNMEGLKNVMSQMQSGKVDPSKIPDNITLEGLSENLKIHEQLFGIVCSVQALSNDQHKDNLYGVIDQHIETLEENMKEILQENELKKFEMNIIAWKRIRACVELLEIGISYVEDLNPSIIEKAKK